MNTDKTVFDAIMQFDVTKMAEFITDLCRERDLYCLEVLQEAGVDATMVSIAREIQVEDNRQWLLTKLSDIS